MKNTILIKRNELQQQIHLRNYYMGEAGKRKDIDADTIQSSKEDEELLMMFTKSACNELVTAVALRFPTIGYTIDDEYIAFEFESRDSGREHLLPLLEQAILDSLVNAVNMKWLMTRRPETANANAALHQVLYNDVQNMFAKFNSNRSIRRRTTDLAGI